MKCSKCGAELTEDAKFCSSCGEKIEAETPSLDSSSNVTTIEETVLQGDSSPINKKKSIADKIKAKSVEFWNKLSLYSKITTVALTVFTLMCVVAFLAGKVFAGIIAIISIVLAIIALLMKKQIIKVPKSWIHIIAWVLAIVLIVPYVGVFKIDYSDARNIKWSDIVLGDVVPEPRVKVGEIISNSENYMLVYIYKTNQDRYDKYVDACKEKGYTIDADTSECSYYAFNKTGYKVSLDFYENDSKMSISVDAPKEYGTLDWPDNGLAKLIPAPKSNVGNIEQDDEKGFKAYVAETSIDEFKTYVKLCAGKGFTIDANDTEKYYSAKNSDGYKLSVEYQGNNVISIALYEPEYKVNIEVECVENLIFSKYDVEVYIDDDYEDTLAHGSTETYSVTLTKGTYAIKFVSAEDDELTGEVKVDITKDEKLKFKISCSSLGIDVETIAGTISEKEDAKSDTTESTTSSKITVTMSEDELKGLDKTEAENKLKDMGFAVFKYDTLDTDKSDLSNKIGAVEIKSWTFGKGDFSKGDTYESDAIVVLWYYKYTEPEKPSSVFYSTNDYETAKKGNTGVFSYKSKKGSYDVYWIINFDEGYVYWFTEGNGESSCDKVKIVSGHLNDKITVTWHDGGEQWSWKLHFKYENHPETLVVNDHNGFATEFTTTDLDDALALRNTKKIKEY